MMIIMHILDGTCVFIIVWFGVESALFNSGFFLPVGSVNILMIGSCFRLCIVVGWFVWRFYG